MRGGIVQSTEMVTLLGGAPLPEADFRAVLARAPLLVAADGAAAAALNWGETPAAVIGDFDSLSHADRARLPADRLHHVAEQDSTDFEKALREIAAPLVLAVGFTGARLDHELAVYNALVRHAERPCIVIGAADICFHLPDELRLDLDPGTRLSLFPMAPVAGRSEGLRWPIQGLRFAPQGRIGTSNQTVAPEVTLRMQGPGMLAILPRRMLAPAIRALAGG